MPTLYTSHNTIIRGVRYITLSSFHGEKSVFEKVGELISVHVIARPHMEVDAILPKGRNNPSAPAGK